MTAIVTVPTGNFTPGALATLQYSANVINAVWDQANTKMASFGTKIDGVETALTGTPVAHITADVANTDGPTEPSVTIPTSVDVSAVMSQFDSKYLELVTMLMDKFTAFKSTYFPDEAGAFAATETWLGNAIANPDSGIPAAIAAQILTDDRDRAYSEASVLSDNLLATFAARRFPLPPGAAASGVLQIQQKSQDLIADSSRKLMMGYVEQMKFAVEKTLGLRQTAMQSAVSYIQALASGPEMASHIIGTGYDAQSKLISAAAGYYGARTEAKRLVHQAEQFNVTTKLDKDVKNQAIDMAIVEERIKTLLSEAQTIGQTAAAMFNNLHSSSGTSYSVTA